MKRVNLVSIMPKPISLKFLVLSKATKILNIITRCSKTVLHKILLITHYWLYTFATKIMQIIGNNLKRLHLMDI